MQKLSLVSAFAGLTLVVGCQTHDRVMYDPEPVPVRSSLIRLDQPRSVSGAPTDQEVTAEDELGLPPVPGQSGLEGPTLIP